MAEVFPAERLRGRFSGIDLDDLLYDDEEPE